MDGFTHYLLKIKIAEKAINIYNSIILYDENLVLKWLVKYLSLQKCLVNLFDLDFIKEKKYKKGYLDLSTKYNLHISIHDFEILYNFRKLYDNYYWLFLNKYTTFTDEDLATITGIKK